MAQMAESTTWSFKLLVFNSPGLSIQGRHIRSIESLSLKLESVLSYIFWRRQISEIQNSNIKYSSSNYLGYLSLRVHHTSIAHEAAAIPS